jgi:FG-GAP repeat
MANLQARLLAHDPLLRVGNGGEFAVSGDMAVVGAPGRDTLYGAETGSAFLFRRGADGRWLSHSEVPGWDLVPHSQFGKAVAITPDVLYVGAPLRSTGSAARWAIPAPADWPGGFFGSELAAAGDFVPIGNGGLYCNRVAVYRRVDLTWVFHGQLDGEDPYGWDQFGASISYSADTQLAIVGAPQWPEPNATGRGAAYVFTRIGDGVWAAPRAAARAGRRTQRPVRFLGRDQWADCTGRGAVGRAAAGASRFGVRLLVAGVLGLPADPPRLGPSGG